MPPFLILLIFLLPLGAGAEKIIGGHVVKPHSRPYMVFVEFLDADGSESYCGGFLVSNNFVLTAAHCFGSSINVTLGAHNIHQQEKTQQFIPVVKAIPHPAYSPKDNLNDIMLLKLESRAKLTKAVRPLRLPTANDQVKPGSVCRLAGWGRTRDAAMSAQLQEVELTVHNEKECKASYPHYSHFKQICAGDPKKMKTPFKVRFKHFTDKPEVTLGDPSCVTTELMESYPVEKQCISPVVFTKISSFLPWIKSSMKPSTWW